MVNQGNDLTIARRRLILRDSLALVSLLSITGLLFAVTLFLFRSYTARRQTIAETWSARGREALHSGRAAEAIVDLHTALTYAPGTRAYELLLAQSLGAAGQTEESYNYFMGLWETEPGNAPVNLELARLAAKRASLGPGKEDRQTAINFYRAAIYGTWEGDGIQRRAEVRLELARYLLAGNDLAAARTELMIAAGNAPETAALDSSVATLFEQAADPTDAETYFDKARAQGYTGPDPVPPPPPPPTEEAPQ